MYGRLNCLNLSRYLRFQLCLRTSFLKCYQDRFALQVNLFLQYEWLKGPNFSKQLNQLDFLLPSVFLSTYILPLTVSAQSSLSTHE